MESEERLADPEKTPSWSTSRDCRSERLSTLQPEPIFGISAVGPVPGALKRVWGLGFRVEG